MACSINNSAIYEWKIDHIDSLFNVLYLKTETSGAFGIDTNQKITTSISKINGSEASVEAPEALLNYHSHPASCYLAERTVWGFPSGEDTRESILFGLKGSIAHLVLTIEGTYVCQINPNILYSIIHLDIDKNTIPQKALDAIRKEKWSVNDFYRGLIVLIIEIYFRSVHVFRASSSVKKNYVDPDDYINFINSFNFQNIFGKNSDNTCTRIRCDKVWTREKKLKQVSFEKYVGDYENSEKIYVCSKI